MHMRAPRCRHRSRARASAHRILQQAEIYRRETVDRARGAAESFRQLAEKVRAAPDVSRRRLWLEKLEEALAEAKVVVYPSEPGKPFKLTDLE